MTFGGAGYDGDTLEVPLQKPIVGGAADPNGGYWLVASDGGVFTFGNAAVLGIDGRHRAQQADRGHGPDRRRRRLLARRLRRGHLHLRRRGVLRVDRGHDAQQADRRHGRHQGRTGLLARRLRRGHLHLRRRTVPGLDRQHRAQQADRRHGRHPGRRRLLARRLRRGHLHLRRRTVPGVGGRHRAQRADRRHGRHPGRERVLDGRAGRRCLRLRRRRLLGQRAVAAAPAALPCAPDDPDPTGGDHHQRRAGAAGHPPGSPAGGLRRATRSPSTRGATCSRPPRPTPSTTAPPRGAASPTERRSCPGATPGRST